MPDLLPHILNLYEGDPCMILRNISTLSRLVKGRRCWACKARPRIVWVTLDNDQNVILPRIPMQKVSNDIKFRRWQVPLRLIYAGRVHRSQGIALNRDIVDLRAPFWQHGQVYVALLRVTNPRNLCILLPDDQEQKLRDMQIRVPIDRQIVDIISRLDLRPTSPVHPFQSGENGQEIELGQPTISSLTPFEAQSDGHPTSHGLPIEAETTESEDSPLLPEEE
jgi:hypothetical protein